MLTTGLEKNRMQVSFKFESFVEKVTEKLDGKQRFLENEELLMLGFPEEIRKSVKRFKHLMMSYTKPEFNSQPKRTAVLLLFYFKNEEVHFILTQRQTYKGRFSGQMCLPGGHYEEKDETLAQTAVREAEEEIGISSEMVTIISDLLPMYSKSLNLELHPFVGYCKEDITEKVKRNEREVAEIIHVKLNDLLNNDNYKFTEKKMGEKVHQMPTFVIGENKDSTKEIWGMTFQILCHFRSVFEYDAKK